MRKRTADSMQRRKILIRSLIYGTLAALVFAAAVSGGQTPGSIALREIAFIEGNVSVVSGYGLIVGLDGTGDGTRLAHTDRTLHATLEHLGIDPMDVPVAIGKVAAVLVQAEVTPGSEIGMTSTVRMTALNDATDLSGGRLVPVILSSRDGRVRGVTSNALATIGVPCNSSAPASAVMQNAFVCSTSVFMTELPGRDFVIELRGLNARQIKLLADRINETFGEIAYAHSGCDIEIKLPSDYVDFDERASLVLQIAALPVEDIVPTLLVEREGVSASAE